MIRFCSLLLLLAQPAFADLSGRIEVVDGDTFRVGGETVRLHGIDAPERDQPCTDSQGRSWPCGAFVSERVHARYDGKSAICEVIETDRYGRYIAKCYVERRDVGDDIVAEGWAQAYRRYSMDYDLTEKAAQVRSVGIWAGSMEAPSDFRATQRAQASQAAPTNCRIKGNISSSGRIYHMPHNRDYQNTRINEARGERWFCSEADAQAAGWRAARN